MTTTEKHPAPLRTASIVKAIAHLRTIARQAGLDAESLRLSIGVPDEAAKGRLIKEIEATVARNADPLTFSRPAPTQHPGVMDVLGIKVIVVTMPTKPEAA